MPDLSEIMVTFSEEQMAALGDSLREQLLRKLAESFPEPRYFLVAIRKNAEPITSGPIRRLRDARGDMRALLHAQRGETQAYPDITEVLIIDGAGALVCSEKRAAD